MINKQLVGSESKIQKHTQTQQIKQTQSHFRHNNKNNNKNIITRTVDLDLILFANFLVDEKLSDFLALIALQLNNLAEVLTTVASEWY
jgi:hypothetical protein